MCLQAPMIDYQQPEKDSATQIGRFRAAGPGSLHFVADAKKPDQVFQAAWQTSVQLGREKGQPVIVMEGRPELAFACGRFADRRIRSGSTCASWMEIRPRDLRSAAVAATSKSNRGSRPIDWSRSATCKLPRRKWPVARSN